MDSLNAISVSFNNTVILAIWFVVPIFLFAIYFQFRLIYKRITFLNKTEWVILRIKPPKDIIKTPKSMEQVFVSLYGMGPPSVNWLEKHLEGKVKLWVSFEIMAHAGGIEFFIRCPKGNRNLVESAIYSQYPESEISETQDYVLQFPRVMPNDIYDLWGTGLVLAEDDGYPIRTYGEFEEIKEEKRTDPLAPLIEALSKLSGDQTAWVHLMISPAGSSLKKKGDDLIKKIIDEKTGKDETSKQFGTFRLTMSDNDVIKAINNKCNKSAFEFCLRFLYIDKKETFSALNHSAILGSFQQFNTQNLNSFKPDGKYKTGYGHWIGRIFPWYKKYQILKKKRILFDALVKRKFGYTGRLGEEEIQMMSAEELATVFHFPSVVVKVPKLQPIYSRKGEAPTNLPLE